MRSVLLLAGTLLLYGSLVFQLYGLQIKNGDYYAAKAEAQNKIAGFLNPIRGGIYFTDKNGNFSLAAINKEYPMIFAVPKEISDPLAVTEKLVLLLGVNRDTTLSALQKTNSEYKLLVRKASAEQVEMIQNAELKGVYVDEERLRYYPLDQLASQVIGFVAPSAEDSMLSGKYGIESQYNVLLAGQPGKVDGDTITRPQAGEDIHLTIDRTVQTKAEEILRATIERFHAIGGTVIVQDPNTGKILAMGNAPSFDPNHYKDYELKDFMNPAVQAIYEPGSIFKVVTMAIGLDSKKITPDTSFVDTGSVTLDGRTIKNWDLKAHGRVTMTNVIEQSINTGAVYAMQQIGKDRFYNYVKQFGFQSVSGIELPGEQAGSLGTLKTSFRDINFATASFGQGVAVTPLQLITAVSVLANGGQLMRPYILASTEPYAVRRVISEEAARQATEMMVSAVKKAEVAQIPHYRIAGKTGTAQIPDPKNGGYLESYIHTYVGFAPATHPKFIILFKVDRPQAPLAGATVVPAFRELAEFLLNYYNVPPDNLTN